MAGQLHFSVDVEDYVSLIARDILGKAIPTDDGVEDEVRRVLDLLDDCQISTTCFVVGQLAKERPALIQELARRGHRIASHGYAHRWMPQLTPSEFEDDLRTSIRVLEDVTGQPIQGFRAPAFSLRREHAWAFPIMAALGITYDSSVHVVWPFGVNQANSLIAEAQSYGITELPGFAIGWKAWRVPLGGGGGLRLVPMAVTSFAVTRILQDGRDIPIYIHPYDLTRHPQVTWPEGEAKARIKLLLRNLTQRIGRGRVAPRFKSLVRYSRAGGLVLTPSRHGS